MGDFVIWWKIIKTVLFIGVRMVVLLYYELHVLFRAKLI